MPGKVQIWSVLAPIPIVLTIACLVAGCSGQSIDAETMDVDQSFEMDIGQTLVQEEQTIVFVNMPQIVTNTTLNALLEIRHLRTGHLYFQTLEDVVQSEEQVLDLSEIGLPVSVDVYLDLNGSGQIEKCGYPRTSNEVVSDTNQDLWISNLQIDSLSDTPIDVSFRKTACGPGDSATSWSGKLDLTQLESTNDRRLYIELRSTHRQDMEAFRTLIELDPAQATENNEINLFLDGLLPGRHEVKAFLDSDQDQGFSPCLPDQIGGGDEMFSETIQFEIEAGQSLLSATTHLLVDSGCPDAPNALAGALDLSVLSTAIDRELEGTLILDLKESNTQNRLYSRDILLGKSDLQPFTITNLPDVELSLTAYLDRDGDLKLSACSADDNGQDLFSSQPQSLRVQPQETRSIGTMRLESHDCPLSQLSRITIPIDIEPVGARKESPRPVYAVIVNEATNEAEQTEIIPNHLSIEPTTSFSKVLAPGDYSFFAFVDTEKDEQFSHCEFDAFGDRALTELYAFSLSPYELFKAPGLPLERLGCDFPTVQFSLNVDVQRRPSSISAMKIVIQLQEAGGLTERSVFDVPPVEPPWFFSITDLVPGQYDVTVFLDKNRDESLAACGDDTESELKGELSFDLSRSNPIENAVVELTDPCETTE